MSFILLGVLNSQATASGLANDFDLLETTLLSTTTASVTFSSLGSYSAYKHLQLRIVTRGDTNWGGTTYLRMNSDTGSNYARHALAGFGSSVASNGNSSAAFIALPFTTADASEPVAQAFGGSVIDILDFANTSKNTTVRGLGGTKRSDSGAGIEMKSGVWINTAAVTSLTISGSSGTFLAGSRFSLYGIK
jgi:hypothetical protein